LILARSESFEIKQGWTLCLILPSIISEIPRSLILYLNLWAYSTSSKSICSIPSVKKLLLIILVLKHRALNMDIFDFTSSPLRSSFGLVSA
jgi:hypothetical protein